MMNRQQIYEALKLTVKASEPSRQAPDEDEKAILETMFWSGAMCALQMMLEHDTPEGFIEGIKDKLRQANMYVDRGVN